MTNYIFVACLSEFGSVTLTDKQGNKWKVTPSGSWIPDEFPRTDRVLLLEKERFCTRQRKTIVQKPIFLVSPSYDQMETIPNGG